MWSSLICHLAVAIPASSPALPPKAVPATQITEENRSYASHISLVPFRVINKMCRLLDLDRKLVDGNDYTRLGRELGLDSRQIQFLKRKFPSPSYVMVRQVFSDKSNSGKLEHLIPLLEKMGRRDVIEVIDRWVYMQPILYKGCLD